ncbi:EamA family transporter [Micromonospora sp. NBC_01813]|uniref:EamA family transporter n=1 Tax=Micromonospora sp. NBC_01813 TaxID=2975988 RepID=UPI002DDC6AFF|nr:EamA family transporter [Micromonospora sp. NBC_01813]WSA09627.1 DMT family transporter [Micromonospora sp. NBC_01813]
MTTAYLRRPLLGLALVIGASALFAINGTVSKLALRAGLDAPQMTLLRAVGAFIGLLALSVVLRPGVRRLRLHRRELPLLIGYGLAGFFLVPMLYFVAIARLPVGIALLFEYTAPLMVALWAWAVQRQQVRPRIWAGLGLSLVGLACVAQVWGGLTLDPIGVAAGLGAAVMLAAYFLIGARGVQDRDALSLTTWAFGASAIAGLILRSLTAGLDGWQPLLTRTEGGVPVALLCCSVVVFGSIVPYLMITAALRHLPATSVGIVAMIEPVLAAAVAWVVIGAGEALTPVQLAGGALVLAGVALAETARPGGPPVTPPVPDGPPPPPAVAPTGSPSAAVAAGPPPVTSATA